VVKVLVGQREGDRFPGFWAEFEGEKVSSYEDTRGRSALSIPSTGVRPTRGRPTASTLRMRPTRKLLSTNYTPLRLTRILWEWVRTTQNLRQGPDSRRVPLVSQRHGRLLP
jgi:hypothetical protein